MDANIVYYAIFLLEPVTGGGEDNVLSVSTGFVGDETGDVLGSVFLYLNLEGEIPLTILGLGRPLTAVIPFDKGTPP